MKNLNETIEAYGRAKDDPPMLTNLRMDTLKTIAAHGGPWESAMAQAALTGAAPANRPNE